MKPTEISKEAAKIIEFMAKWKYDAFEKQAILKSAASVYEHVATLETCKAGIMYAIENAKNGDNK